jgi:hypothetical protein
MRETLPGGDVTARPYDSATAWEESGPASEPSPARSGHWLLWIGLVVINLAILGYFTIGPSLLGRFWPTSPGDEQVSRPDRSTFEKDGSPSHNPDGESTPKPPVKPPLPPAEQEKVDKAIERGLKYLRSAQSPNGSWPGSYPLGTTALPALTMLECGLPGNDPQVQKAAAFIRKEAPAQTRTYDASLALLFLSRLGESQDRPLIQNLAMRLVVKQTAAGGWHYDCPPLDRGKEQKLVEALEEIRARPWEDFTLIRVGPQVPNDNTGQRVIPGRPQDKPPPPPGERHVPPELADIPALQPPVPDKKFPDYDPSDNSCTQFATLALWTARQHNVPVDHVLARTARRFRISQGADGSWAYNFQRGSAGGGSASMTAAGLLGVAVGHGLQGPTTGDKDVKDTILQKGLTALARNIGTPATDPSQRGRGRTSFNLYFLWSVERVCMLYSLTNVDGKDWYRWGSEVLLDNQADQGHWSGGGYHGSDPIIDTSFALLFLKRANLAKDLTEKLEFLTGIRRD